MPPKQVEQKVTCSSNFWHGENKHFDMQISPTSPPLSPEKKKKYLNYYTSLPITFQTLVWHLSREPMKEMSPLKKINKQ